MIRRFKVTVRQVERASDADSGLPHWRVAFNISHENDVIVSSSVKVRGSAQSEKADVVAEAWRHLWEISNALGATPLGMTPDPDFRSRPLLPGT